MRVRDKGHIISGSHIGSLHKNMILEDTLTEACKIHICESFHDCESVFCTSVSNYSC